MVLFRHVQNSMPVYLLSAMSIPKEGIRRLEQTFANLLWGETEGRKKDHWVAWHKVCRSVREGELGIRSLEINVPLSYYLSLQDAFENVPLSYYLASFVL